MKPDIEVLFEFIGTRTTPAVSGYRPAHMIIDNYLTTGVHNYDSGTILPDGTATGTISFISPEVYPHCLWVGKKISIQEGERIVGYATIKKVVNPILLLKDGAEGR